MDTRGDSQVDPQTAGRLYANFRQCFLFSRAYYLRRFTPRFPPFKLTSVFHAFVLLLILHFVTTLSKWLWMQTILKLWRNSLSITGQTIKSWHQFSFYDNKLSDYPISCVNASHKFMCLSVYWQSKLATNKLENLCSYRKNFDFSDVKNYSCTIYCPPKQILPNLQVSKKSHAPENSSPSSN